MAVNDAGLLNSIKDYEMQLTQINNAIASSVGNFEELVSLRNAIVELISLTKESLPSAELSELHKNDPLTREYELFKAELVSETTKTTDENGGLEAVDFKEELNSLIGSMCRAPFSEEWSVDSHTYHNALITGVDTGNNMSYDEIKVKVLFVNPICREMIPCQYYLDGECKFSDENCHFSHGYVVCFSDLKEYEQPDFCLLEENAPVLAKDTDNLWKRAVVCTVFEEDNQCQIKFESGSKPEFLVDIHNILPLSQNEIAIRQDKTSYDKRESNDSIGDTFSREALIEESLQRQTSDVQLGAWEKYTTGIGSKLMANMGYVVGTGLGKKGEGRIEPIVATILPPRTSLDYCMNLKEKAGGNSNLFKVNQLQKKIRRIKRFTNPNNVSSVEKRPKDVFSFLNSSISGDSSEKFEEKTPSTSLKKSSSQALNVEELKLNESMDKKKYELHVFSERLSRHKRDTVGYNTVLKKIKLVENELLSMQKSLNTVQKEQTFRQTMRELTEF